MTITLSDDVVRILVDHPTFKTDTRVLFSILSGNGAVDLDALAESVKISRKSVRKSIRRLTGAGVIQASPPEPRKVSFHCPGVDVAGNAEVRTDPPHVELDVHLVDRISHLEDAISRIVGAVDKRTDTDGHIPIPEQEVPENAYNKPAAMLLNNSKQASAADEFKLLFGVPVPPDVMDMAAVAEMVRRKKDGKLAIVKNPAGYLRSLVGKMADPVKISPSVPIVDLARVDREREITSMWMAMTDDQKAPYRERAGSRQLSGCFKVPLELLARQAFNTEKMAEVPR